MVATGRLLQRSRLTGVLVVALLTTSCALLRPSWQLADRGYVKLDDFIASVKAARADDYLGRRGTRVRDTAAFEEMRTPIVSMYDGITMTHSFVARDGAHVDCIALQQQPALKHPLLKTRQIAREAGPVLMDPVLATGPKVPPDGV